MPQTVSFSRAKQASLLALAGGVFANAGQAQIITFNIGGVTLDSNGESYTLPLPGAENLVFKHLNGDVFLRTSPASSATGGNRYAARIRCTANSSIAKQTNAGKFFHSIGPKVTSDAPVIVKSVGPANYDHKYIAFSFKDSSDATHNKTKFGWVELSATQSGDTAVTLWNWAYQNNGSEIAMGAVPEPQSAAMATGAALVAGATGIRAWRRRASQLAG